MRKRYSAAYEGSGLNGDEIWEEVVCDSLGDMNIFREFRNGKMAETILREVRIQAESGVQSARGPPQEGANVPTKMSRGNWHSNLPKRQMIELCEWVKRDIRTSKNRVSDTANWAFRMYNGAPEFSIYSTQDLSEPTILYAVKGAQAEYERTYLEKELERIDYGRSIDGESRAINIVLSGSWLLDTGSTGDSDGTVGRKRSSGDAGVLRKSSGRKPSAAFESVLRNLLQAEIEGTSGKYSRELGMTSTVDHRGNRSVTDERIQRQMEALKTQYRKVLEAEELDEAFLHGFNMEE